MRCALHLTWISFALLLGGCERPTFEPGGQCELNNECAAPLVCRLGRCRVECRATRDCDPGLECIRNEAALGACQLPDERSCRLTSECEDFLVCRFGQCTNACMGDRDCPPGARCVEDDTGMLGCRDQSEVDCTLNSDCTSPYVCAPDRRCREECITDRDCRDGNVCLAMMSPAVCGPASLRPDAGPMDAGPTDAGDGDAGALVPPPPPLLGAGLAHTCASVSGEVRCWGANESGQLGDGGTTSSTLPIAVTLPSAAVLVTGGSAHSCAVHATGMTCWGDNTRGQLGTGGASGAPPALVAGLPSPPTSISAGVAHTCAIAGGTLYCWGDNQQGQLGTGTTSMTPLPPTAVTLPGTPTLVTSFSNHTCALLDDGRVLCFGDNSSGEVGTGVVGGSIPTPTLVTGLPTSIHVSTGSTHSCAVTADGRVFCWGNNAIGQLGDGTMGMSRGTAVPTGPLGGTALQLALGSTHACVRTTAGVACWGDNSFGQVGLDNAIGSNLIVRSPAEPGVGAVDEIVAGSAHTCVRSGATLQCFGQNGTGQLGNPAYTMSDSWTPQPVGW